MSYLKNLTQMFFDSKNVAPKNSNNKSMQKNKQKNSTNSQPPKQTQEQIVEHIVAERLKYLNPTLSISYLSKPIRIKVARGQYLFDETGHRILDCINNVSHIGHCHPYYVEKMQQQQSRLLTNSRFLYDQMLQATKKLLSKFPPELCVVTYTNSGSQANDIAMQMAEIHSKKTGLICLQGGYHGITKSCFQVSPYTWNQQVKKPDHITIAKSPCTYRGFLAGSQTPSDDYAEYLDTIIGENNGAFICQLMQSCAGQLIPPRDFYQKAYQKLKKKGVVCICDQVQTGFGRVGENYWAFEYYGVMPDIVTVGKAMGNGFPVSAVICTKQVAESFKKRGIQYFSTFGGNPLAVTAVSVVLDVIDHQKLQQNARETGIYLLSQLETLKKYDFVGDVRGIGLFQGVDIVKSKQSKEQDGETAYKIITMLRQRNVIVSRDGVKGNVLKIKPPIIFNKQNVDQLMNAFSQVLPEIQKSRV